MLITSSVTSTRRAHLPRDTSTSFCRVHVAQSESQTRQHVCEKSALTKHSAPGSCVMSTLCLTDLLLYLSPANSGASDVPSVHRALLERRTGEGRRLLEGALRAKKSSLSLQVEPTSPLMSSTLTLMTRASCSSKCSTRLRKGKATEASRPRRSGTSIWVGR